MTTTTPSDHSPAPNPPGEVSVPLPTGLRVAISAVAIITGILALAVPGLTLLAVALLVGMELIFLGVLRIALGISTRGLAVWARTLTVIFGVITVIAGFICVFDPGTSLAFVALFLGIGWIADGISTVAGAVRQRRDESRAELIGAVVGGLVSVIAGVVILVAPGATLVALTKVSGVLLLVIGVFYLIVAVSHGRGGRRDTDAGTADV